MQKFKVMIKRITYDGTIWNTRMIRAKDETEAFNIIAEDYNLADCLDYWVSIYSNIWMNNESKG